MRKFFKLCVNENIKLMKKTSTKVLVILAILALFGAAIFTKLITSTSGYNSANNDKMFEQIANSQMEALKSDIKSAKENNNVNLLAESEARLEMTEYAVNNGIKMFYYGHSDWKVELVNKLITEKTVLNKMEKMPEVTDKKDVEKQKKLVDKLFGLLKESNFDGYIDNTIIGLKESYDKKEITKQEYDDKVEVQNLYKKHEIGKVNKQEENWKLEVASEISRINDCLRTGISPMTNKVLTPDEIQKQEETKLINLYRLEHNIAPTTTQNGIGNYRNFYDSVAEMLSMMFVGILIIITAGSAISAEISKGSIKFLIMTPNKRWKILLAKMFNMVVVLIILTLLLSALNFVVGNIFFGSYQAQPYLYVNDGQVHSLNYMVAEVLRFLTYDIDILIYMLLSMMLSVVTRNTALSVSLSVAFYFGSSVVMTIVNQFVTSEWIKFIPFNNMNLTDKIFPNSTSFMMMGGGSGIAGSIPVIFSLAVLGVCAILMIVTMFDSFNKRDIT